MSADETAVAKVLAEHRTGVTRETVQCPPECGWLHLRGPGAPAAWEAHVASILAPLLQQAREEGKAVGWEVGYQRGVRDTEGDMERADNPYIIGSQR